MSRRAFFVELNQTPSSPNVVEVYQKVQELRSHVSTLALVLSLTITTALIGNLFLTFLIAKMRRRRFGPVQILILHTCLADICFVLLTALPQLFTLILPHFYGGDVLCRLVKYLQLIPMFASPYLLVALSVDRYVAICKPLLALRWKYRLVHTLAAIAWGASFLFSIPNIFAFGYERINNASVCTFRMGETFEKAWIGVFSLIVWLVPTIIVSAMYSFVCAAVRRSARRTNKYSYSMVDQASSIQHDVIRARISSCHRLTTPKVSRCHHPRSSSYRSDCDFEAATAGITVRKIFAPSINSYKMKTVKLTMTIVVANFVLWAPFCITNLIDSFLGNVEIDLLAITCIMLVGNANSCVNPWIYVMFNYKRVWEVFRGTERNQPSPNLSFRHFRSKRTAPHAIRCSNDVPVRTKNPSTRLESNRGETQL